MSKEIDSVLLLVVGSRRGATLCNKFYDVIILSHTVRIVCFLMLSNTRAWIQFALTIHFEAINAFHTAKTVLQDLGCMNWRSRLLEEQSVSHVVMTPEIWSEDCCEFLLLATLVTHAYFHFFM